MLEVVLHCFALQGFDIWFIMIYQTQRVKPPILYQYHTILSR